MEPDKNEDNFSFEHSLREMEDIINRLEQGECNLDDSFKLFEKAVFISKKLKKKLSSYERKIEIISEELSEDGSLKTEPFDEDQMDNRFG